MNLMVYSMYTEDALIADPEVVHVVMIGAIVYAVIPGIMEIYRTLSIDASCETRYNKGTMLQHMFHLDALTLIMLNGVTATKPVTRIS